VRADSLPECAAGEVLSDEVDGLAARVVPPVIAGDDVAVLEGLEHTDLCTAAAAAAAAAAQAVGGFGCVAAAADGESDYDGRMFGNLVSGGSPSLKALATTSAPRGSPSLKA